MNTWTTRFGRIGRHTQYFATCRSGRLAAWAGLHELTQIERGLVAVGGVAMGGLLIALAMTCQESVLRGERLRAEQRNAPVVTVASAGTVSPSASR